MNPGNGDNVSMSTKCEKKKRNIHVLTYIYVHVKKLDYGTYPKPQLLLARRTTWVTTILYPITMKVPILGIVSINTKVEKSLGS